MRLLLRVMLCIALAHMACASAAVTPTVAMPSVAESQKDERGPTSSTVASIGASTGDAPGAAEVPGANGREAPESGLALRDAVRTYLANGKLSVYFERDSLDLTDAALATIADNAERLKANRGAAVTLVGFTDDLGSSSYSVALAQRRAAAVTNALIRLGVGPYQIRSTAYGQERFSMVPCITEACRRAYRRVEFRYANNLRDRD